MASACNAQLRDVRLDHDTAIKNFLLSKQREGVDLSRHCFLLQVFAVNAHGREVKGVHITPGKEYVVGNRKEGTHIFGSVPRDAIVLLPTYCEIGETLAVSFTAKGSRCSARNTLNKFEKSGRYVAASKPGTSVYKAFPLYSPIIKLREQIFHFDNDELNSSEHFGIHEYYSKLAFNENRLINCQELLDLLLREGPIPFRDKKLRLNGTNIIARLRDAEAARRQTPLKLIGSQALICIKDFVNKNVLDIDRGLRSKPNKYDNFNAPGITKCISFSIVIFSACSGSTSHTKTNGGFNRRTGSFTHPPNVTSQEPDFNWNKRAELFRESGGSSDPPTSSVTNRPRNSRGTNRPSRPLSVTSLSANNRSRANNRNINHEYISVLRQFNRNTTSTTENGRSTSRSRNRPRPSNFVKND